MLNKLLTFQRDQFENLADYWLDAGATVFSVYGENGALSTWPDGVHCEDEGISAEICVGSRVIGELCVCGLDTIDAQRRLKVDAEFITRLAQLENGKQSIVDELIHTRDQLLAMYDLTQATRDCWDIDQTLKHLAGEVAGMLKSEAAFLLVEIDDDAIHCAQHPASILEESQMLQYLTVFKTSNQPYLLDRYPNPNQPERDSSLLLVTIQLFDAKAGVLGIMNHNGNEFMSPEIKLTSAIAEYAGSLLENAIMFQSSIEQAKFQTEMELAHEVQNSLLPKVSPNIHGLDVWAFSQPASHVGGDFYDFIVWPNGGFTFVVGDISGKGMPAAMLMTVTRTIIRMIANNLDTSTPKEILDLSNTALYEDLNRVSMFVTVFVGHYEPSNQILVFANAGHAPVIYCSAEGDAQLLIADGTALGVLEANFLEDQYIRFEPGDMLIVGSDGFFDSRTEKDSYHGYEYLLKALNSLIGKPSRAIAEGLRQSSVSRSINHIHDDDQTLVVLKFTGG